MSDQGFLNRCWDAMAQARVRFFGRSFPAFQVCGYTGVLAAIVLAMTLIGKTGLSYWVMGAIVLSAMATFVALVFATKIITGEEHIIYYHHEIGVILVAAILVKILHRPVLPYLDLTILGIGAFLACGRIGCLMVGCCHGRPSAWGICYREEHAREGFAPYLVGIRLFPIQAVESLWVLGVVIFGARFVSEGHPPGTALAWYTIAYGAARFSFEFVRGDTDRPYTWGFSQGQWLSLWLMGSLAWAELSGRLTFHAWHVAAAAALPVVMLLVALWRSFDDARKFQILHPHHVGEVASAMESLNAICRRQEREPERAGTSAAVPLACTSMGLQISAGNIEDKRSAVTHFTISCRGRRITPKFAVIVADLILQLERQSHRRELIAGEEGVFHLLLTRASQNGVAL
jgi:hypothetical protein